MNKPTFYEQLGIVIPGSVLLFGLLLLFPDRLEWVTEHAVSIGQLGIFILLSYAAGQAVAAIGNVGESLLWRIAGGMPSDWVIKSETILISPQQYDLLEAKVRSHLRVTVTSIRGLEQKVWRPISRQLHAHVARHGKLDRIETFNGNYGLNRGLAASCFLLAVVAAVISKWVAVTALLFLSCIYAYRAYRFGVHYARELYVQFLAIDEGAKGETP